MSVLDRPALVPVALGYCPCDGAPHHPEGDIVYLYPELSMPGGMAAQGAIAEASGPLGIDQLRLQELLATVWIEHGIASWTFLDDFGELIPVTPANARAALPYMKGGRLVADKADDIYAEAVTAPLLERLNELSKRGSITGRDRTSRNGTTHRSRRKSSSTATTEKALPAE